MKKFKKTVVLSVAVAELAAFVANSSFVNRGALAFLNKKLDSKNVGVFKKFKNCENVLSEKKKFSKRCKNKVNRDLFNIIKKYLKKYEVFLCCFSTSLVFSIFLNYFAKKPKVKVIEVRNQPKEKTAESKEIVKNTGTNITGKGDSESENITPDMSDLEGNLKSDALKIEKCKIIKIAFIFYIVLFICLLLAIRIANKNEEIFKAREEQECLKDIEKHTTIFNSKGFPEAKNIRTDYNGEGEEINIIDYPYKPGSIIMPKISKWKNPIIVGEPDEEIS